MTEELHCSDCGKVIEEGQSNPGLFGPLCEACSVPAEDEEEKKP